MAQAQLSVPRIIPVLGMLLSLIGIGVSTYLTISHFVTKVVLACPDKGVINCAKVTTSSYSEILGIPLAVLGLIFFIVMLVLQTPWLWRSASTVIRRGRLLFGITGVIMIIWLVYVELFRLNAICLYCTFVHILTLMVFILTLIGTAVTSE